MVNPYETPKFGYERREVAERRDVRRARILFYAHLALIAGYTIVIRYFATSHSPLSSWRWLVTPLLLSVLASWFVFPLAMVWLTSKEKLNERQRVTFVIADILLVTFHAATLLSMLNHWRDSH